MQPKCPLMNEWTNRMWHIHAVEYNSALEKEDILTHASTRMNSEDIMLSEPPEGQILYDSTYVRYLE